MMMKPKVCLTTLEFPPDVGGVGESVQRIAHMLIDLGYEVHVVVFRSRHSQGELRRSHCQTTTQGRVTVHRLWSAIRLSEPTLQDYLSEIHFLLNRLHHEQAFDLYHAFFINETGFLTTLIAKEQAVPVINSIRGADLHKHIFDPKQHSQICWTLDHSDWITFVSQDLLRRAELLLPTVRSKSSAFWNSIQPIDFAQLARPALVKCLQGMIIGCVGRFRDKKGLEFLLDACAELVQDIDLTLLLVGDYADKEYTYWEQQVQQSGLADRIVLTGMVERLQGLAYLPYMDVFVASSLRDGCPNSLLEAMLAGRAIVGTSVDAIGEILEDGINALVVQPGSSAELVNAIRTLARSPELRYRLGQAARSKVLTSLSPDVEQQQWSRVYQQVLEVGATPLAIR